jgi:hypothetical protein
MANKQTAIQWFNQQIVDKQNGNGDSRSWDQIFEQAMQMEREQIMDSYWEGGQDVPTISKRCEQYYNQTYGA